MSFGKTLQRIRRSKGKTQRFVADAMKMDYGYFSRMENDQFDYKPSRETIDKIADALECNESERSELFAEAGRIDEEMEKAAHLTNTRPELRLLFRAAVKLSPEKVKELTELAQSNVEKPKKQGEKK
jgi:transcriptional regulator with XRE-family HTH domain